MRFFIQKTVFLLLISMVYLSTFSVFGQTPVDSYQNLWSAVHSDTVTNKKKLHYLDVYYQKAQTENNQLEQYRALKKKSFLVSFNEGVLLLRRMDPLVADLKNDSLKGDFLNRSAVLYYDNRMFREALDYAIQSEAFNEKNNYPYNLNVVRITIGNIYYHTRNYQKAVDYFILAKDYYKDFKNYNHLRGYISSLYSLSKTYWQLENTVALTATIEESETLLSRLKPVHKTLETAYLDYIKGGQAFLQKDYSAAQHYFETALPVIKQNGDFTNEHVIYLYLGKIAWVQNQKQQAIVYFTKPDQLFQEKKFLNYELRKTYDHLIAYYKETGQTELQLQATESLIALNRQFEKEQQNITSTLHKELDTKKLENDRAQLQKQLKSNKTTYNFWLIVSAIALLILTVYSYWQNREKRKLKSKFDGLLVKIQDEKQQQASFKTVTESDTSRLESEAPKQKSNSISQKVTEQRLLHELKRFEQEKRYLTPVKIEDLSLQLGTNRTTLSNFLNSHKGGFTSYLAKLRINRILIDLTQQQELRRCGMQELSEMYGFASVRSFNSQFKTETGLTPSYFIKQLELKDLEEEKEIKSLESKEEE